MEKELVIDLEEIAKYISKKALIPYSIVHRVLEVETEWMEENGFIEEEKQVSIIIGCYLIQSEMVEYFYVFIQVVHQDIRKLQITTI